MDNTDVSWPPVQTIYHATPLHYLPEIIVCRELRSQRLVGYERARPTARRRDRMLSVDCYVHCSLRTRTPLIVHKLERGYPHVVLEFDISKRIDLEFSVLACSTKAWRSNWQCRPIADKVDVARLIRLSAEGLRYPNLEVLIKDKLPFDSLKSILLPSDFEFEVVHKLLDNCNLTDSVAATISPQLSVSYYQPTHIGKIRDYYDRYISSGYRADLPLLPFD
jgi:hypothetical protein